MDKDGENEFIERLKKVFTKANRELFDGLIPQHEIKLSRKAYRTHGSVNLTKKIIRISLPLYKQFGWNAVYQTLLHEMTHAYIYELGGRTGHTKRFWSEFSKRGGVREKIYVEPDDHYVYACPTCETEIKRVRKIKQPWRYSCIKCDKNYNPRHRLYLKRDKGQKSIVLA